MYMERLNMNNDTKLMWRDIAILTSLILNISMLSILVDILK